MREHGKLYTCDRCMERGFFAVEPSAWDFEVGVGDLCPKCSSQWKEVKSRFKKNTHKFW